MFENIDTIQTRMPGSKKITMLLRKDYLQLSDFIVSAFEDKNEITLTELINKATEQDFKYSKEKALWMLIKVKQDLVYRGVLRNRFIGLSQSLRINKKALALIDKR